jgi:metallophosphoesterase superfamily enzyme
MGELKDGRKLITLPAVGAYQTGSKVTTARDTYLSPILRDEAIIEKLKPIIVDEEIGLFELPTLSELMDLI